MDRGRGRGWEGVGGAGEGRGREASGGSKLFGCNPGFQLSCTHALSDAPCPSLFPHPLLVLRVEVCQLAFVPLAPHPPRTPRLRLLRLPLSLSAHPPLIPRPCLMPFAPLPLPTHRSFSALRSASCSRDSASSDRSCSLASARASASLRQLHGGHCCLISNAGGARAEEVIIAPGRLRCVLMVSGFCKWGNSFSPALCFRPSRRLQHSITLRRDIQAHMCKCSAPNPLHFASPGWPTTLTLATIPGPLPIALYWLSHCTCPGHCMPCNAYAGRMQPVSASCSFDTCMRSE